MRQCKTFIMEATKSAGRGLLEEWWVGRIGRSREFQGLFRPTGWRTAKMIGETGVLAAVSESAITNQP
jgi:hypothetical protein